MKWVKSAILFVVIVTACGTAGPVAGPPHAGGPVATPAAQSDEPSMEEGQAQPPIEAAQPAAFSEMNSCVSTVDPNAVVAPYSVGVRFSSVQLWVETSADVLRAAIGEADVLEAGVRSYLMLTGFDGLLAQSSVVADASEPDLALEVLQLRHEAARDILAAVGDQNVYIGIGRPVATPRIHLVLWPDADGSIQVAGPCDPAPETIRLFLQDYAAAFAPDEPMDVIRRLVQSESVGKTIDDWIGGEPVRWEDRSPATRQIDPEDTPSEIFDTLTLVNVYVDLPAAWRTGNTLCARTELGWSECISLDSSEIAVDARLNISVYVDESSDRSLEFWILDPDADLSNPLVQLGAVPYATGTSELTVSVTEPNGSVDEFITQRAVLDLVSLVPASG